MTSVPVGVQEEPELALGHEASSDLIVSTLGRC